MAYQTGDVILRNEYNTFATGSATGAANHAVANINSVWGVGNGDRGYGQGTTLAAVAVGDTVTATQWSTLIARLNSILVHQAGTGSGITSPVTGDVISAIGTLSTNITTAFNNRLNFTSRSTSATNTLTAVWNQATPTLFQQIRTVTFASADAARYFFNAGGRITLSWSASAGTDNFKEQSWTNILTANLATISLDALTSTRSGSGGTLTTDGSAIGYYDLTTSDQLLIRLTQTQANYTTNYVNVAVRSNGVQGSNADTGTILTFTSYYVDDATDTFDDAINMTIGCNVIVSYPEVTNIANVWGVVTTATTLN